MKVGRLNQNGREVFVASADASTWYALPDLGFDIATTGEVIARDADIRTAVGEGAGSPVDVSAGFLSPVVRPSKMFGIGLNYMDHIRETNAKVPDTPVVFAKFPNSLTGPRGDIVMDTAISDKVDYEVELAVVLGKEVRNASVDDALESVYGYCVANDVTARDLQKAEPQFSRAKSFDTFCPMGPWITTREEIDSPQDLRLSSTVNGESRQDSTTAEMIFSTAELIAFLSRGLTLEPGDVILTGTPHGVGFAMDPPRYLKPGDVVRCEVEKLGLIENTVRGAGE